MNNESFLIVRLRNNDKEAYKWVFRTYYRELLYLSLKYFTDPDDAKDVVQSTFLKLWEHRDSLLEDKPLKPFLLTIHRNNCLDTLKHRRTKEKIIENQSIFPDNSQPEDAFTPFDELILHDLEYKVLEAISELPNQCRIIFELSRFDGLKYKEIAEKLGISVNTVENQMSIALEKLRKKLREFRDFRK